MNHESLKNVRDTKNMLMKYNVLPSDAQYHYQDEEKTVISKKNLYFQGDHR